MIFFFFKINTINIPVPIPNVIYHHFGRDHHFMQGTQQFDLIDVMNGDVNHHVNEKCE